MQSTTRFFFAFVGLQVGAIAASLEAQTSAADSVPIPAGLAPQASWVHQVFGPAMLPLWLCSVILVALILNRTRAMRRSRVLGATTLRDLKELLGQLKIEEAREHAANSGTLIGSAWSRGLGEFALGYTSLNDALSHSSVVALKTLRKHLWLITTISVIAPMFGLIGTVVGMIITFSTLAETGGMDKSKLAVGLSFALYKTAGGLIIAIPGIISGRYFAARVVAYGDEVENEILNVCRAYGEGSRQAERAREVEAAPA